MCNSGNIFLTDISLEFLKGEVSLIYCVICKEYYVSMGSIFVIVCMDLSPLSSFMMLVALLV